MVTKFLTEMTDLERYEFRVYGCTKAEMGEVIDGYIQSGRWTSYAEGATSMLKTCQELLHLDNGGQYELPEIEEVRQLLNRAIWVLQNRV